MRIEITICLRKYWTFGTRVKCDLIVALTAYWSAPAPSMDYDYDGRQQRKILRELGNTEHDEKRDRKCSATGLRCVTAVWYAYVG